MDAKLTPELLLRQAPFAATVGVEFGRLEPGEVTACLAWAPERCTVAGVLHGGALVTLADAVAGVCAYLNLPPGAQTATVSMAVSLLRAVTSGTVQATARPLHLGLSFSVIQTELRDGDGCLTGHVVQTQAVLR